MSTKCRLLQKPSHKLVTFYDGNILFFYGTATIYTSNATTGRLWFIWVSHIGALNAMKKAEEIEYYLNNIMQNASGGSWETKPAERLDPVRTDCKCN